MKGNNNIIYYKPRSEIGRSTVIFSSFSKLQCLHGVFFAIKQSFGPQSHTLWIGLSMPVGTLNVSFIANSEHCSKIQKLNETYL